MIQVCQDHFTVIKDYGKVHKGPIISIIGSIDRKYIWTAETSGKIIQFCLKTQKAIRKIELPTNCCGINHISVVENLSENKSISSLTRTYDYGEYSIGEPNIHLIVLSEDSDIFISQNILSNFVHKWNGKFLSYCNDKLDPKGLAYFHSERDLNYISSLLLSRIDDPFYDNEV